MKRLIFLLKLALFVLFLAQNGAISYIINFEPELVFLSKDDGGERDRQFLIEITEKAADLGKEYSPEKYFADLLAIDEWGDSCGYDTRVNHLLQNVKEQLNNQYHRNLKEIINYSRQGSEYKQTYLDRCEKAQLAYQLARDPDYLIKKAEREAKLRDPSYWKQLTNNFFNSFAKFYLRNFVLAFFLLLVWKHENKEEKGLNPLSFLLMWAIYPISIFIVFMRKFGQNTKHWAFYLVLRRRSVNLFSLFSDDEIRDIKALAKTMKIKEYRERLRLEGFEIRHSLVAASLATLILGTLNVLPLELISKNLDLHLEIDSEIDCFKEDGSVLKILPTDLSSLEKGSDSETKDQTLSPISSLAILPDRILEPILTELKLNRAIKNYNILSGFKNNPDHVPLFLVNNQQIVNFKKIKRHEKHETYYSYYYRRTSFIYD